MPSGRRCCTQAAQVHKRRPATTADGTRLPATEFADFLARNLGWICVALSKGGCELRFRPSKVRNAALAVVADKLRRVGARRYRIARFCDGWREEEFANPSEAIVRVMALADGARAAARAGDFLQSAAIFG